MAPQDRARDRSHGKIDKRQVAETGVGVGNPTTPERMSSQGGTIFCHPLAGYRAAIRDPELTDDTPYACPCGGRKREKTRWVDIPGITIRSSGSVLPLDASRQAKTFKYEFRAEIRR